MNMGAVSDCCCDVRIVATADFRRVRRWENGSRDRRLTFGAAGLDNGRKMRGQMFAAALMWLNNAHWLADSFNTYQYKAGATHVAEASRTRAFF